MCLHREFERSIASIHLNEKLLFSFHKNNFNSFDLQSCTIKLKIINDILVEQTNTGLGLIFATSFSNKFFPKYNHYSLGNSICYFIQISDIKKHGYALYQLLHGMLYLHYGKKKFTQENFKSQ
jgi:hypothetical protein